MLRRFDITLNYKLPKFRENILLRGGLRKGLDYYTVPRAMALHMYKGLTTTACLCKRPSNRKHAKWNTHRILFIVYYYVQYRLAGFGWIVSLIFLRFESE